MKKAKRIGKKVLSVFLSVLMIFSAWVFVAPEAKAADGYAVDVYMYIYDGANSDGYGKAYTVVDDPTSEFYGKPENYKWYDGTWSNSDGYDGEINMAGVTLFYNDDNGVKQYRTYDLANDLVAATTELGNNWTSMDDLDLSNFESDATYKISKVLTFENVGFPTEVFWLNDENNAVNGETSFGIYKIVYREMSSGKSQTLWTGLSGSESYTYCYYGSITPSGIITPWDDCPSANTKKFYKEYTTSAVGTWLDPFREEDFNQYPVNNNLSGGVSVAITLAQPGATTNVDYVDVKNTNVYYVNFLNHSTQTATVTVPYNSYMLVSYSEGFKINPGESKSFAIDKTQIVQGVDGFGFSDLSFSYTLSDVYEKDGTTLAKFTQPAGIATLVGDVSTEANAFQLDNFGNFYLTFQANKGILETQSISNNNSAAVSFVKNYYYDTAGVNTWEDIGFRLQMTENNYRRINFQNPSYTPGSVKIGGDIGNSNSVSLRFADFVFGSFADKAYTFNSEGGFAYYGTTYTPTWVDKSSDSFATLYNNNTAWMRFTGTAFKGAYSENPATITFNNMKFRDSGGYTATFSGTINVYPYDKTDLRSYVQNIGGLGANWAPIEGRYNPTLWTAYKNAYLEAVKVLGNGKTNQKAVTDAYNALVNACENLKKADNLVSQLAEVTYTKRTTDYVSAATATTKKYLIMPIGTETVIPALDAYKHTNLGANEVSKQSFETKNYTISDTIINPIDYRYWKINFAGVEEALTRAKNIMDTPLETYSSEYYEKVQDARTALSAFDRNADTYTPTHQENVNKALSTLNDLLAHTEGDDSCTFEVISSTDATCTERGYDTEVCKVCGKTRTVYTTDAPAGHSWKDVANQEANNAAQHYYNCKNCDAKFYADHTFTYVETAPTYEAPGSKVGTCSACGYETTETLPQLVDGNAPAFTFSGNGNAASDIFCKEVNITITDDRTFTVSVTKDGEEYAVENPAAFSLTQAGTYEITATDASNNTVTKTVTVAADHSVESWNPVDENNHKGECTTCGDEITASHVFSNPVLVRPTLVDGEWVNGTYTYTCVCKATKIEDAVRADYSELEDAVAALEELNENDKLTDDAKAEIAEALDKAEKLADDLVTSEQNQIDDLVKEIEDVKADVEKAIEEAKTTAPVTEANSGIKVQFLKKTGIDAIESVQLNSAGGFETIRMKLSNNNATLPITITSVESGKEKAYIGADESASSNLYNTKTVIDVDGSKDLYIVAPEDFKDTGIIIYTIKYNVGSDDIGYLKGADGKAAEFTTKAYLYVKGEKFTPYHLMDEDCTNGPATAEWDYSLEAAIGDFAPVYYNKAPEAPFAADGVNLKREKAFALSVYDFYDFEDTACYAKCTGTGDEPYIKGDAHAATYRYYIDTSLAPRWQDAGFKAVFAETAESVYDNATFKYIRLANNKAYYDNISESDKTFTVTLIPGKSSNVPTKTWTTSSIGDEALTVSHYDNPDQNDYIFGNYLDEAQDIYTAYSNFSGYIPKETEDAKMMFSHRFEYNMAEDHFLGGKQAEATTMTTHLYITSYDKAELRTAVENAEQAGYNSEYFDAVKWAAYEDALMEAKEVLGKAETNQKEIDEATKGLEDAIKDLAEAESETKFVLTVTHSIHENADKNSEATSEKLDYYLVNGYVTPLRDAAAMALTTINKYDNEASLTVTEDATHTYNYWYIDYSAVQGVIDAADAVINDTTTGYTDEYKNEVKAVRDALQTVLDGKDVKTTPESQQTVTDAIDAVNNLINHEHSYADATCEAPKTCTVCGVTDGEALSHEDRTNDHYCDNGCGDKISDCTDATNDGDHNCDICGADEVTSHDWNAATCEAPKTCKECGVTDGEALDHEDRTNDHYCDNGCGDKISDCTDATNDGDHNCDICGADEVTSHDWNAATCTDPKICKECGATDGEAKGHTWGTPVLTTAPTADKQGEYTETCGICGATQTTKVDLADYDEFDAVVEQLENLKNTENLTDEAKAAIDEALADAEELDKNLPADTTTADGKEIKGSQDEIDALVDELQQVVADTNEGIDNGTKVYVNLDAYNAALEIYNTATATVVKAEDSVKANEAIDSVKDIRETTTVADGQDAIDAATAILEAFNSKYANCAVNNHDEESITTDPTCTGKGYTTYTCKVCGTARSSDFVDANGHNWSEWVLDPAPTNETEGTYTRTCSVGDATETKTVAREDYTEYDKAIEDANDLLEDSTLTDAAKDEIREAITEAEKLDQNLPADVVEDGNTIIDNKSDEKIADATDALNEVLDKITGDTTGAYEKVDYTAYNAAINAYTGLADVMTDDDKALVEAIRAEIAEIPADGTKAQYQAQVDQAAADIAAINAKYGDCANGNHTWGEPVLTKVPTAETKGEYTETCGICGATQITKVDLADYDEFDAVVEQLENLKNTENLTDEAKTAIDEALADAKALDKNLPADTTTADGKLIEGGQDEIDALVSKLTGVKAEIESGIENGTDLYVNLDAYNAALEVYNNKVLEFVTDEDAATVQGAIDSVVHINEKTTVADGQDAIDAATAIIVAINAKYGDCANGNHTWGEPVLTKAPTAETQGEYTETCGICGATQITKVDLADYDEFDAVVEQLENLKNTENLTDEAKAAIDEALADAKALDKNLPADTTTADGKEIKGGQDEIDALVDELQQVVADTNADITSGSALKPDYSAWENAEDAYEALDKTNVKTNIIAEAESLKAEIADKQADDTLTQATATQKDIDDATARLNEIIAGIEDGSLKNPADYTEVEKDLADAKDKAENNDVADNVKDDIQEIEDKLNELKNDPTTNADDQDEIDALEKELEDIIAGIENGTLVKPDFDEWYEVLEEYNNLTPDGTIKDSAQNSANDLIDEVAEIESNPDATKADYQDTIETDTDALRDIITGINDGSLLEPDYTEAEEALGRAEGHGEMLSEEEVEELAELRTQLETLQNAEETNKRDHQDDVDAIKDAANKIYEKYEDCAVGDHTWGEWELTLAPTATVAGKYESKCTICGADTFRYVAREDYTDYDAAVERAETMLQNATLTDAAKAIIKTALDEAKELDQNLPKDLFDYDGTTKFVDNNNDVIIKEATDKLNAVLDKINSDTTGAYEKVDYTAYNAAINAYTGLADVMTDDDKALVEAIKAEIAEIPADGTKAQYQAQVDQAAADIAAINAKYGDCADGKHTWGEPVLTKAPTAETQGEYTETCGICGATQITKVDLADYDEFDAVVEQLENLKNTENLTDEAKAAIDEALADAEALDKNLPADTTTADGKEIKGSQDEINALVDELQQVVADTNADITSGSALKPDYSAWENAEYAYEALDKTNVKADIIAEAESLKAEIADKQVDDTLTQATATQKDIDDATARLNEIIAGIEDGSLKNPADYTEVEKDLADAKDKAENNDVADNVKDDIQEIEDKLNELKNDPTTNADDQDEIDALEKELEDIIAGIEDGSLVKPDFDDYDASHDKYEELVDQYGSSIKDIVAEDVADLDEIVDGVRGNETATKADDQAVVDGAKTDLDEIIAGIENGTLRDPDYTEAEKDLADAKDKADKNVVIDGVKEDIQEIEDKLNELKNDPTTNADDQDEIDALEKELEDIIAGIEDGSLVKPDYTDVDKAIEDAENIDSLTDEEKKALEDLKDALDEIKNDPTSNSKDDQTAVDNIKDAAQDIIDKYLDCASGNHKWSDWVLDPAPTAESDGTYTRTCEICSVAETKTVAREDYTEYDKAIEDANALLEDATLTDAAKDEIREAIAEAEKLDQNLPADVVEDGKTIIDKDSAEKIADATDALNEVLDKITGDTTGVYEKPDYNAWETAEGKYDALEKTNVKTDIIAEVNTLKDEIADKQADDTLTQATATQKDIDDATARLNEIIAGIIDGSLVKPDYTEAEKDLEDAKDKAENNDVADNVKDDIQEIEDKLNELKNDPTSNSKENQDDVDALEKELEDIIAGIEDGTLVKPDFDDYDASHDKYEELVDQYGSSIKDSVAEDVADLDEIVDGVRGDETATKADDQVVVDGAKTDLDEIIAGIENGTLRDPDYTEAEKDLADAKDKAENNDVADNVKDDIQEIEDKLNEIKNDPTTNANDQDEIDALEKELEDIIADITSGSALKPDYTAWENAEDAYEALDKTNVKTDIIAEVNTLKDEIADKQADDTLTQATATQKDIDDATARLNEIIAGINDGSLRNPDYTEVEKDLAEAKDKAGSNDVIDGVKESIQQIEDKIDEIRNDPATNGNSQAYLDILEDKLEDIIAGIEDGTLVEPDFTGADAAIKEAEKIDILTDEEKNAVKDLKDDLSEIKQKPDSTKKDDQADIDAIEDAAQHIIDKYADCLANGHDYDAVVTKPDCVNGGYTTHTCTKCGHSYTDSVVGPNGHDYDHDNDGKDDGVLTRPVQNADGTWVNGFYTYTCVACDNAKKTTVKRANYSEYDSIVKSLKALLPNLTDSAKAVINAAIENAEIAKNLIASEQAIVDAATKALKDLYTSIANDDSNYRPDYTEVDKVINKYEDVSSKVVIPGDVQTEIDKALEEIDSIKNNPNANKKDHQLTLDSLKDRIQGLISKYEGCANGHHVDENDDHLCDNCGCEYVVVDGCVCHRGNVFSLIIRFICTCLTWLFRTKITCCPDMEYYFDGVDDIT